MRLVVKCYFFSDELSTSSNIGGDCSFTNSPTETECAPSLPTKGKSSDDTDKLLEIEAGRLDIERERLKVERERLQVEKDRVNIDRERLLIEQQKHQLYLAQLGINLQMAGQQTVVIENTEGMQVADQQTVTD